MSSATFTNLTPDTAPTGAPLPLGSGTRYFYFRFVAPSNYVDFFLSRNRYANEELITRLYTETSDTSLLTIYNVINITFPTTFANGSIGILTPAGSSYINASNAANCRIMNLAQGAVYYIESKTIYNDTGSDFGLSMRSSTGTVTPLTYTRTETSSIPLPPTPPPPPPPPPPPSGGIPAPPTGLTVTSGLYGAVVTWTASAGATYYQVYRYGIYVGNTASIKFIDSHAISGSTYSYSVSAGNANGQSAQTAAVTATPVFAFTDLVPDRTPQGISLVDVSVRYYYFLFNPITSNIDAFLHFNGVANQAAIIGLYNASEPATNLLNVSTTITNIDSNIVLGEFTLGYAPDPQVTAHGIRLTAIEGPYSNTTMTPNFKINGLKMLTTYILEVVCVSNHADGASADLAIQAKNGTNLTQIVFHTTSLTRGVPSPYIITYHFTSTSHVYFSTFVSPNLYVFQNVKNVLENVIGVSPGARASGRTNDMLVNFIVEDLPSGVLGQSSINKWKQDSTRSPDFPYEQTITFSSGYFTNGYFGSKAKFNGSDILNSATNTSFFNTLIHEMLHGIGIYYTDYYNTSNMNYGWNNCLTNVAEGNPWYRGPSTMTSAALESYKLNCMNSNLLRIPVEKDYGSGTANSHWDEGDTSSSTPEKRYFSTLYHPALRLELMTGFLNKDDYLTGLTAGALKDYGYNVNMNSPYIAGYPYSQIPTAALETIPCNHKCVHENDVFMAVDTSCWSTGMMTADTSCWSTGMAAIDTSANTIVSIQQPQQQVIYPPWHWQPWQPWHPWHPWHPWQPTQVNLQFQ